MPDEAEPDPERFRAPRESKSGARRCRCPECGYTVNLRTWHLDWDCPALRCRGKLEPCED